MLLPVMRGRALLAWNLRRVRVLRGISQERLAADAAVDRASSIADYVARSLAATYLGRVIPASGADLPDKPEEPPLLPLALPRRRAHAPLRLVG